MKVTRTQKLSHPERVKADTIFIIGNGFDRWQGLNTSYADFHAYYLRHRDEILKNWGCHRDGSKCHSPKRAGCGRLEMSFFEILSPSKRKRNVLFKI